MGLFIGIDVGGTFTDFLVMDGPEVGVFKVLSTPQDPSIGVLDGLSEIASSRQLSLEEFLPQVDRIVHGTTITTNAVLTQRGAKTALLTTEGVRDALEMRRGIREEQYNNRFTNVPPLAPRHLRIGIPGRLDGQGKELEPLDLQKLEEACKFFEKEKVEALAICYMNSFSNGTHEESTRAFLKEHLPDLHHSFSVDVLPSIRFYNRVSTTVLNAYVGPVLSRYMDSLSRRLKEKGFQGILLIMQSNGGVVVPEVVREKAALTLLSGPAAGPAAGILYTSPLELKDCITVDMGGTSFDAALIKDGEPSLETEGEINRYRIALPMVGIVTIGAGGGSIGWIDEGGLLRMGPQSAGSDPGPACYAKGGTEATVTDADLVLGYLDPEYFAGGKMKLDRQASCKAIQENIAHPLKMSVEEAAMGMYRVINNNMALGVREATIQKGYDPREFPMVVAGGAGPLHSCMIARELEMPFFIVPRESSIFCAAGMLMTDLKHDLVRSYVSPWHSLNPEDLKKTLGEMISEGRKILEEEGIEEEKTLFSLKMDFRYLKQYHEVSVPVSPLDVGISSAKISGDNLFKIKKEGKTGGSFEPEKVLSLFHSEHNRLYGYSLEEEKTPVELINLRLQAIGETERPIFSREKIPSTSTGSLKGTRKAFIPESGEFREIEIYDALKVGVGSFIKGPALLEQPATTIFVSETFDMVVDSMGSYVVYVREKKNHLQRYLSI